MVKVGWRGLVSGLISVLMISFCILSLSIFMSGIFIYSAVKHTNNQEIVRGCADLIIASYLNPFDPAPRYFAGQILAVSGDKKGALMYYDQVIKRSPNFLIVRELKNLVMEE